MMPPAVSQAAAVVNRAGGGVEGLGARGGEASAANNAVASACGHGGRVGTRRRSCSSPAMPHRPQLVSLVRWRTRSWMRPRQCSASVTRRIQPASALERLGVDDVGGAIRKAFGEHEAGRERLQIGGRHHHHGIAETIHLDRDRRLDRKRAFAGRRPVRPQDERGVRPAMTS